MHERSNSGLGRTTDAANRSVISSVISEVNENPVDFITAIAQMYRITSQDNLEELKKDLEEAELSMDQIRILQGTVQLDTMQVKARLRVWQGYEKKL